MRQTIISTLIAAAGLAASPVVLAETHDHASHALGDARQAVHMPPELKTHMLANMRDHLVALGEIQGALAKGEFDRAADVAESRIGMSSLEAHGASHVAPYMSKPMQEIGTAMHRSASRFARTTQEASFDSDLPRALGALADLTQKCVACHAGYRLR
jgi:hypothetical protein